MDVVDQMTGIYRVSATQGKVRLAGKISTG